MWSQPAAKTYVEGSAKILGATGLPSDLTTGIRLWPGNGKPNPGGKLAGSSSPLGGGGFTYRAGEPSDEVARWRGEGRVGNAYLAAGRPPVLFRSSFGGGGDLEGRGGCSSLSLSGCGRHERHGGAKIEKLERAGRKDRVLRALAFGNFGRAARQAREVRFGARWTWTRAGAARVRRLGRSVALI